MHAEQPEFIGRKAELASLVEAYGTKSGQLVLLSGRRRIGKTYLLQHFSQGGDDIPWLMIGRNRTQRAVLERAPHVRSYSVDDMFA